MSTLQKSITRFIPLILCLILVNIEEAEGQGAYHLTDVGWSDPAIGTWDPDTRIATLTADLDQGVQIDTDNVTLEGNGHTITGTGSGNGVYLWMKTGVTIKNLNVTQFSNGISLQDCNSCILEGNNVSSNNDGIQLYRSPSNTLTNNTLNSNTGNGIDLTQNSNDNILSGNTCNSNGNYGIYMENCGNNTFTNNTMSANRYDFYLIGSGGDYYYHHDIDTSNLVGGKPMYYIVGATGQTYGASIDPGLLYFISCDDITVRDLAISNKFYGIFFRSTHNSRIENVFVSNSIRGVYLYNSNNNVVTDSNATSNMWGFYLISSSNNTLSDNYANSNFYGIYLNVSSHNNMLEGNATNSNNHFGIGLRSSNGNTLVDNSITNSSKGISLHSAGSNTITENTVVLNGWGIYLIYSSDNNRIYLNDFVDNLAYGNGYSFDNTGNLWNSPEPVDYVYNETEYTNYLGNRWSDYWGVDTDNDGIGDTPYNLESDNDQYPLMQPFWLYFQPPPPALEETTSNAQTTFEVVVSQHMTMTTTSVTGDLEADIELTNVEAVHISSGPFEDEGFFKGDWSATIDGSYYTGEWHGVSFDKEEEGKVYLKGTISGDLTGIMDGYAGESVPGNGIYDHFQFTWTLNMNGAEPACIKLVIDGTVELYDITEYPSEKLYLLQSALEGNARGDYEGSLNIVLTHIRIDNEANPYYGEGFSIISYTSRNGAGSGWSYDVVNEPGRVEQRGMFTEPLLGTIYGILDETVQPRRLQLEIKMIWSELPAAPILNLELWGPQRISPGETVTYIIEYRNDGSADAPDVAVIMQLSPFVNFVSGSSGVQYIEETAEVAWNLGDLPAGTVDHLAVQVEVMWGLPGHMKLHNYANIESFQWHSDTMGEVRNGVRLPPNEYVTKLIYDYGIIFEESATYKSWRSVGSKYDAGWKPILNTGGDPIGLTDAMHAALASPIFGDGNGNPVPTEYNDQDEVREILNYIICYSGGNPVTDGRLKRGKDMLGTTEGEEFTLYKVSPILFDFRTLLPIYKEKGVKKVVLYQSKYDDLLDGFSGTISYKKQFGGDWKLDLEIQEEEIKAPLLDEIGAKLSGVSDAIHMLEESLGKEVEYFAINATSNPNNEYGPDLLVFQVAGEEYPRSFFLQGNPMTGALFKEEDFADIEGIEVEIRNRSEYKITHGGWQNWMLLEDIFTGTVPQGPGALLGSFAGIGTSEIVTARDPNEKFVLPEGKVDPGYRLNYTIDYENEGEGTAYGVYITDTLEADLDDLTLFINNDGIYDPQTRAISWFIGEVGPGQTGSVTFGVNVKGDIEDYSEVINYATVHFPSAGEATRTNATVNIISFAPTDTIAPVTMAWTTPPANGAGWNNTDVNVNLSAVDDAGGSGVMELYYKLSGASMAEELVFGQTAQVILSAEGATTFTYLAVDNAANAETPKSLEVKIDKTPPAISLSLDAIERKHRRCCHHHLFRLTCNAEDDLSGVKKLKVSLVTPDITGYRIKLKKGKFPNITINQRKRSLTIKGPDAEDILNQLKKGLLLVDNDQTLRLRRRPKCGKRWSIKKKKHYLVIKAPSIDFKAEAADSADNVSQEQLHYRKL
ncbi:MAG: right-handed parallel beta-helix repeat-containing protein [Candidatus Omnitrophica bacterium]|nr:right-handed parallel beta-helix repeat-containing protein [Candidatus Omnitrophota bacterium]